MLRFNAVKLTSKGEDYSYDVVIMIGTEEYTITPDNGVYTIQGKDITGNITITVTETAPTVEDHTVTFQGSGVDDVTSGTENQKVANNGTYTFKLKPVDGYEYSVSAVMGTEAKTVTKTGEANDDGSYTYTVEDITANLTITIEKSDLKVEVNEYVVLKGDATQNESDKVVYLVTATQTLDDNKTLGYNISESETADYKPMYLKTYTVKETNAETGEESSRKVQMYSYLVILDKAANGENDAFNEEVAAEKIAVLNVAPTVLPETFNVNKSNVTEGNAVGTVDINDAQLVHDMYNAMYKAFDEAVSMEKFLLADVNGDRTIGVQDAAAIVTEILK